MGSLMSGNTTSLRGSKKVDSKSIKEQRTLLNEYDETQNTFFQALSNVDESSKQLFNDIITPLLSPVQTAKDMYSLGKSVVSLIPGIEGDDSTARAVGNFFKDRYGSLESIKQTFATDPVGMLSDVSVIFTGGSMLPGKVGKISKIASIADPVNVATQAVKGTSKLAGLGIKPSLGLVTGAGGEAITKAIQAGKDAGPAGLIPNPVKSIKNKKLQSVSNSQKNIDFRNAMDGTEEISSIVTSVNKTFSDMKKLKNDNFTKDLAKLNLSNKKIDFSKIQNQILELGASKEFAGASSLSKESLKAYDDILNVVKEFESNPALHNAQGMHMLKMQIKDMYPSSVDAPRGAKNLNIDAVKIFDNAINDVSTGYKDVNKNFAIATSLEKELEDALSVGNKAKASTTLKKLQSLMKSNTTSNLGSRLQVFEKIEKLNEGNILEKVAGQALKSPVPTGIYAAGAGTAGLTGAALASQGIINPAIIGGLLATSPRLVGNVANTLGKAEGLISPTLQASRLSGEIGMNRGLLE